MVLETLVLFHLAGKRMNTVTIEIIHLLRQTLNLKLHQRQTQTYLKRMEEYLL